MAAAVTPAGVRDGDPAALQGLCARRGRAVLSYCERVTEPGRAEEAAAEAFARFRADVVSAPDPRALDPGALLVRATRLAAAERAPRPQAQHARLRRRGAGSRCEEVPGLLALRAEEALSDERARRLAGHLERCADCQAADARARAAEHAYRAAPPTPLPGEIAGSLVEAMRAIAPLAAEHGSVTVGAPDEASTAAGDDFPRLADELDDLRRRVTPVTTAAATLGGAAVKEGGRGADEQRVNGNGHATLTRAPDGAATAGHDDTEIEDAAPGTDALSPGAGDDPAAANEAPEAIDTTGTAESDDALPPTQAFAIEDAAAADPGATAAEDDALRRTEALAVVETPLATDDALPRTEALAVVETPPDADDALSRTEALAVVETPAGDTAPSPVVEVSPSGDTAPSAAVEDAPRERARWVVVLAPAAVLGVAVLGALAASGLLGGDEPTPTIDTAAREVVVDDTRANPIRVLDVPPAPSTAAFQAVQERRRARAEARARAAAAAAAAAAAEEDDAEPSTSSTSEQGETTIGETPGAEIPQNPAPAAPQTASSPAPVQRTPLPSRPQPRRSAPEPREPAVVNGEPRP